jgi:hypothetical protein
MCVVSVTQHSSMLSQAGVALASPAPVAPDVPMLQAADMLPSPMLRTTCLLFVH